MSICEEIHELWCPQRQIGLVKLAQCFHCGVTNCLCVMNICTAFAQLGHNKRSVLLQLWRFEIPHILQNLYGANLRAFHFQNFLHRLTKA